MKIALLFSALVAGAFGFARRVAKELVARSDDLARAALGALRP